MLQDLLYNLVVLCRYNVVLYILGTSTILSSGLILLLFLEVLLITGYDNGRVCYLNIGLVI